MIPFRTSISRGDRGFTLIELLIALSILGLLTSLCAGLLHLGGRSWEKANRMSGDIAAIESMQSLIRMELTRARLAPDKSTSFAAFNGGADLVVFKAPLPQSLESNGPADIRLGLQSSDANGKNLVMEWRVPGVDDWTQSIILPGIEYARFEYYGPAAEAAPPEWQANWTARKILPLAVRLDIGFPAGDSRSWPAFIVAPLITTDISCLHNTTGQC